MAEALAWHTDFAAVVLHPSDPSVWVLADPGDQDPFGPVLQLRRHDSLWYGNAEKIVRLAREAWGVECIVLRSPSFHVDREAHEIHLSLLLQAQPEAMPAHGKWVPAADLSTGAPDAAIANLLATAVRELEQPLSGSRTPWYERGWFARATAWADAALAGSGLERRGLARHYRNWGLSSVIRLETDGGAVYFKAAAFDGALALAGDGRPQGVLFSNEAGLLAGLTGRFPDHLPRLLASDPENVWIVAPDFGPSLALSTDVDAWEEALRLHARHQRAYVGREAELAGLGCLSRPLDRLQIQFAALLGDDALLAFLSPTDRDRLRDIAGTARAAIAELAGCGIPDTLVHGDLHAGNVATGGGRPLFFDWTDASIGHPFLDVATFLMPCRLFDEQPDARDRLRAAYLSEWDGVVSPADLARAAGVMLPVGMIHQSVAYHAMVVSLTGPDRDDVGGGAAYWLKELIAWADPTATRA